jgi:hypothetical protein
MDVKISIITYWETICSDSNSVATLYSKIGIGMKRMDTKTSFIIQKFDSFIRQIIQNNFYSLRYSISRMIELITDQDLFKLNPPPASAKNNIHKNNFKFTFPRKFALHRSVLQPEDLEA